MFQERVVQRKMRRNIALLAKRAGTPHDQSIGVFLAWIGVWIA
jgi:hypothetical protein